LFYLLFINKLNSALGVSDIDIDPSLLKGDFDPEKHEELVEKLAANFGDDELDENGEIMKVTLIYSGG
jgi:dephospho-CoA kinase